LKLMFNSWEFKIFFFFLILRASGNQRVWESKGVFPIYVTQPPDAEWIFFYSIRQRNLSLLQLINLKSLWPFKKQFLLHLAYS
jgi:hypothetical protein